MRNRIILCLLICFTLSCKKASDKKVGEVLIPSDSIASYSDKIIAFPNDSELKFNRAKQYFKIDNTEAGFLDLYKAIKLNPSASNYYLLGIDQFLKRNDIRSAIELAEQSVASNPNKVSLVHKLGFLNLILKDYQKSNVLLKKAISLDPVNQEVLMHYSISLREQNKRIAEKSTLLRLIEINPEHKDALIMIAQWYENEDVIIAEKYYDTIERLFPDDSNSLYAVAMFQQSQNHLTKAKELYQQIIDVDKKHFNTYYNLGSLSLQQDSIQLGLSYFLEANKVGENTVKSLSAIAYCYELLGNGNESYDYYIKVLKLDSKNESAMNGVVRLKKILDDN